MFSAKMRIISWLMLLLTTSLSCQHPAPSFRLDTYLAGLPSLTGKTDYLSSPFATTGRQMYLIGHQDGSFPDLGWHVQGEMGGLWQHPIKLADGFEVAISSTTGQHICLHQAQTFRNYPIASQQDYDYPELGLQVQRTQLVTDSIPGLIVELSIRNTSASPFTGLLNFTSLIDLRPVWLGERTGMLDQPDEASFDASSGTWIAKDQGNNWYCTWRASRTGTSTRAANCSGASPAGLGTATASQYPITMAANEQQSIHFFITGSDSSLDQAMQRLDLLQNQTAQLVQDKRNTYEQIRQTALLEIPDTSLQTAWEWTKYASQWLRFEQAQGTGIAAGLPDYPWWFGCDQTYAVRGLVGTGMADWSVDILTTLLDLSEQHNGNGQIVHEVSTNGSVYNPGNINETPHFISAAWEVFRWTGDEAFLQRAYQQAKAGLNWLESRDKDRNGYPDGHGMMEIHGLDSEMIDVVAYTCEAYQAAAQMASYLGDVDLAKAYTRKAQVLQSQINTDWWVATAGSYADFRASRTKALNLLDAAIVRADTLNKPWSVKELVAARKAIRQQPADSITAQAFYHNWVVNTPLETGTADPEKAALALETDSLYVNPFGRYVTGIDRKQEEAHPEAFAALKAQENFNYTGAVMTLPTGVQAIAAARYGQADLALGYLQRMLRSFNYAHPGSMYEVSPDYGMLVQAWNIYGLARPIVTHFLGIQPDAQLKRVQIHPGLPTEWQRVSLQQLPIGNNQISYTIDGDVHQIEQQADWELHFIAPFGKIITAVNGKSVNAEKQVVLREKHNTIHLK